MFPMYINNNFHTKVSLKKLMEVIEEYSNVMAKEADELLAIVQKDADERELAGLITSTVTIQLGSSDLVDTQDVLSIFFSPEVKELGRKKRDSDGADERTSPGDIA
ncbi:hypothetical protein GE061_007834, partial [Apolygus lucorum]